ncbi:MAG: hypothetical protein HGA96_04245 [Desulfobulbaceae bacterium]|nr:hypothetical protein [Desulfobulbaceae bacterium]
MTLKKRRDRISNHHEGSFEIPDLVKLWLLRLLVPLGAHREFVRSGSFREDNLARILGLGAWIDDDDLDFDQKKICAYLRKTHLEFERTYRAKSPKILLDNISKLSRLVGLSETDCRILEFAVYIHTERLLDDTADWLGQMQSGKIYQVLSVLLDIPGQEIRAALSSKAILANSGLLAMDRDGTGVLRCKLNLLSNGFADSILYSDADPVTLLRNIVVPSSPTTLNFADFAHISPALKLLVPYIKQALATKRQGVNIFLHGLPGNGKSELSRLLAQEMASELYEVASEDDDGDPVGGEQRLRAFRAA